MRWTMMRMMLQMIIVVGVLACVIGGVPVAAQDTVPDAAPVDTTLFLTYIPNIQFAPVYVALEKGYFEEAGFNVTIEHGDEPLGVNLIAAGERQFGIISGEQVIAARANERPVTFVYQWFQQFPVGVAVTTESGIESVEDLRGQRVGVPIRAGASYSGVVALLNAHGLTEQDVQLEEIGFNAPEVMCVDGIDAATVYINNEPLQIEDRIAAQDCDGVDGLTVLRLDAAATLVSNGLITNEQMIAEHPDQVRAVVEAFERGLRDTIQNPAEAYLISMNYVENLPTSDEMDQVLADEAEAQRILIETGVDMDRESVAAQRTALYDRLVDQFNRQDLLQFRVLLTTIDLWDADPLGHSDPAAWEATQQSLIATGMLDAPIDLSGAYTDEFLPEEVPST